MGKKPLNAIRRREEGIAVYPRGSAAPTFWRLGEGRGQTAQHFVSVKTRYDEPARR